jgi:hypothetical protein
MHKTYFRGLIANVLESKEQPQALKSYLSQFAPQTKSLSVVSSKNSAKSKSKTKDYMIAKTIELESKEEELQLLRDKITQITFSRTEGHKTPSFSNLGTFTSPMNLQTLNAADMFGKEFST